MLDAVKKDIKFFVENELKITCSMKGIGKAIKHYPKWLDGALKRAEADKSGKLMQEYSERYPLFAEYVAERKRKLYERAIELKENKIKKITEGEIGHIKKLNQKIKKRVGGFSGKFYSKKEKEQINRDLDVNQEIIDNLKKNTENLNFAGELAEKEWLEKERKAKAKNLKKGETKMNAIYDAVYLDGKFYDLDEPQKELKIGIYDSENARNLKNGDMVRLVMPDCMQGTNSSSYEVEAVNPEPRTPNLTPDPKTEAVNPISLKEEEELLKFKFNFQAPEPSREYDFKNLSENDRKQMSELAKERFANFKEKYPVHTFEKDENGKNTGWSYVPNTQENKNKINELTASDKNVIDNFRQNIGDMDVKKEIPQPAVTEEEQLYIPPRGRGR